MSRERRGKIGGSARTGGVQLKARDPGKRALTDSLTRAAGPDQAVDAATTGAGAGVPFRDEMERGFGTDFSDVQAYTGRGEELDEIGAEAATFGTDGRIAFADESPSKETVAHELAHVQQARNTGGAPGPQARSASELSRGGDPAELEADAAASIVAGGGTVAPESLTARGTGVMRKETIGDILAQHVADHVKGGPELVTFLNAVAANDKPAALAAWATVPSSARDLLDNRTILTKLPGYHPAGLKSDVAESVLAVLGPDAIKILAQAGIALMKPAYGKIILADHVNAVDWVAAFTANPLSLFAFVNFATPNAATVTAVQAKQMADFADQMPGIYAELLFERIYPKLVDTSYDTDRVKTRAWTAPDAKRMFRGLADYVPPAHVHTIVKGFYLGTHSVDKGVDTPLGYGWYTASGRVVMPAKPGYTGTGVSHGMSGGADSATKMGHFESTLLHEIGHGVGAKTDGDKWAEGWGNWEKQSIGAWSKQLFDDAAAKAVTDPLVTAGTLTEKGVLPPSSARTWLSQKIAERDTSLVVTKGSSMFDLKMWSDAEVEAFIRAYYSGQKLFRYWDRALGADSAYLVDADNLGADGRYHAYLSRMDDSHAVYDATVFANKVSSYSLSSPSEWFSEQYSEYYRTHKASGVLPASVKTKLDDLDKMKWDDDKEKLKAPGAADDDSAKKKYTDEERVDEFVKMFSWWT